MSIDENANPVRLPLCLRVQIVAIFQSGITEKQLISAKSVAIARINAAADELRTWLQPLASGLAGEVRRIRDEVLPLVTELEVVRRYDGSRCGVVFGRRGAQPQPERAMQQQREQHEASLRHRFHMHMCDTAELRRQPLLFIFVKRVRVAARPTRLHTRG